jgi:8-amino-7-oxononanoate synthase
VLTNLEEQLEEELRALEDRGRLRAPPEVTGGSRTLPALGGLPLASFCSNDYLGLASHPALKEAAARAADASGFGASASRLVSGDFPEHRSLERKLAQLVGLPSALLFPTGYQANIGVVTALASREDLILSDAANHASLIDGCRLSRARVEVFPHRDLQALEAALANAPPSRRRIIVTESLFSMDGDLAPLADLADLARRYEAALVVDEAHALGVLGPSGRGLCREAGVVPDALVGTLGKSFAAQGGFVAGTAAMTRLLVNKARTFIFTTATPPPVAAAAERAVDLSSGPEGDLRRGALFSRIEQLRAFLPGPRTPIIPLIVGTDRAAIAASSSLRSRGLFVQAIRPPTVPEGTARLRITLSAEHDEAQVAALVAALRELRP